MTDNSTPVALTSKDVVERIVREAFKSGWIKAAEHADDRRLILWAENDDAAYDLGCSIYQTLREIAIRESLAKLPTHDGLRVAMSQTKDTTRCGVCGDFDKYTCKCVTQRETPRPAPETFVRRSLAGLKTLDRDNNSCAVEPVLGTDKQISDKYLESKILYASESTNYLAFVELWERRGELKANEPRDLGEQLEQFFEDTK